MLNCLLKCHLIGSGVTLPEFPDDGYPDVPEMEPLKSKLAHFMSLWLRMESAVTETPLVLVTDFEIEGQTPEMLLNQSILAMERK